MPYDKKAIFAINKKYGFAHLIVLGQYDKRNMQ
jgi:hypothetical protein